MTSFRRALLYGFLVWLIPFLVAFLIFPLRESSRPLFESIMPVTLAMATAVFGVLYFKNLASNHVRNYIKEGLVVGMLWWIISVLIDAPLMLLGGPMQMTLGGYFADIGLTYMMMPVITVAIGASVASRSPSENSDT